MRIESVTAQDFGPLVGRSLALAPGLTVVVGANESAKSSWHAAIYAGLCGRRRGKGATTRADRRFAELHKPWDGGDWRARVVVLLDDGRRIEITQDLGGRVDSRAVDLGLARDVSNEIMFDGCPDGSRWLGLDRDSFLATACINQAALLRVLDEAEGLQGHIAAAAANAGADANAAKALASIEDFFREQVGRDFRGAAKPLRKARLAVAAATDAHVRAVAEHEQYVTLMAEAEGLRATSAAAAVSLHKAAERANALQGLLTAARGAESASAEADHAEERSGTRQAECISLASRLARAVELDELLGGRAPSSMAEDDVRSRAVSEALARWRADVAPPALEGESAASLRERLAGIGEVPTGDIDVDPAVRQAAATLERSRAVLAAHSDLRPVEPVAALDPDVAAAVDATAAVVRDLAADLAAATAVTAPDEAAIARLKEAASRARAEADRMRGAAEAATVPTPARHLTADVSADRRRALALIVGGVLGASGVVLLVLGVRLIGLAAVAAGVGLVGWGLASRRSRALETATGLHVGSATSLAPTWTEVSTADRAGNAVEQEWKAAVGARAAAVASLADVEARCRARGLPVDAGRLRVLAAEVELSRAQRTAFAQWSADEGDYEASVAQADERLRAELRRRSAADADASIGSATADLLEQYEHDCAARADLAAAAAVRPALAQRFAQRLQQEQVFANALARHRQSAAEIMQVAGEVLGLPTAGPDGDEGAVDEAASKLAQWQEMRSSQAAEADSLRSSWAEREALLDGLTLAELRWRVDEADSLYRESTQTSERARSHALAESSRLVELARALAVVEEAVDVAAVQALASSAQAEVERVRAVRVLAASAADSAQAVGEERGGRLASVAEAQETLAAEQAGLDRVLELAATLDLTATFLRQAQERVYRDIAPVLVRTLEKWLPSVTGGRYVNAMVDPASLVVQVRGPDQPWRRADLLSVGTAEQVYLLLRVALAEHLAVTGETCPLLLDDVTVQADPVRTERILDLLLMLSRDRQIVLFAQEPMVAQWASQALSGTQNALIQLEPVATA